MKDFFTRYRESRKNPIILPAFLALGVSFLTVATIQGTPVNLKSLSANVVGGLEEKVMYPADLMMERKDKTLTFLIGKDAENVKSVHFSLLGDPSVFIGIRGENGAIISMNEPGVALVRVPLEKSLKAGDIIATLTPTLSGETPLTIIDAGFSSESGDYSLSVKGE